MAYRIAGASFITYFQQDQNWGDGGIQEVVEYHYNLNKRDEYFKSFIRRAYERVIDPLVEKNSKNYHRDQGLRGGGIIGPLKSKAKTNAK